MLLARSDEKGGLNARFFDPADWVKTDLIIG